MTSIGETLHRERLRRGLQLEQVAAQTKIGLHLLEAMEADQFDRLPGGVFTRSFVRQYARTLGVDEEELVASLKQQFEEPADPLPPPEPPQISRLPRLAPLKEVRERLGSDSSLSAFVWVVVVIFACAGVYSLWQNGRRTPPRTETIARSPRPAPRVSLPADLKPSPQPARPVEPPKPEFHAAEVSASGSIRVPPAPEPSVPSEPDSTVDAAAAMRVALTTTEPVWVSIKSDGNRAYSGTIEGHESRQFGASRKMTLLVGNAGALQISLNGKPVGPIGPRGEIRFLVLTPAGAHVVPRTPPTPPPTPEGATVPAAEERP